MILLLHLPLIGPKKHIPIENERLSVVANQLACFRARPWRFQGVVKIDTEFGATSCFRSHLLHENFLF